LDRASDYKRGKGVVLFNGTKTVGSEPLTISEGHGDPITKRIQEVILPIAVLVSHSKTLDLVDQVVLCPSFVGADFIEGMIGIFYLSAINITGYAECSLIFPHRRQFRVDRCCRPSSTKGLLQ
jgi:hypothetical protein